jgi:hypothetical protein
MPVISTVIYELSFSIMNTAISCVQSSAYENSGGFDVHLFS